MWAQYIIISQISKTKENQIIYFLIEKKWSEFTLGTKSRLELRWAKQAPGCANNVSSWIHKYRSLTVPALASHLGSALVEWKLFWNSFRNSYREHFVEGGHVGCAHNEGWPRQGVHSRTTRLRARLLLSKVSLQSVVFSIEVSDMLTLHFGRIVHFSGRRGALDSSLRIDAMPGPFYTPESLDTCIPLLVPLFQRYYIYIKKMYFWNTNLFFILFAFLVRKEFRFLLFLIMMAGWFLFGSASNTVHARVRADLRAEHNTATTPKAGASVEFSSQGSAPGRRKAADYSPARHVEVKQMINQLNRKKYVHPRQMVPVVQYMEKDRTVFLELRIVTRVRLLLRRLAAGNAEDYNDVMRSLAEMGLRDDCFEVYARMRKNMTNPDIETLNCLVLAAIRANRPAHEVDDVLNHFKKAFGIKANARTYAHRISEFDKKSEGIKKQSGKGDVRKAFALYESMKKQTPPIRPDIEVLNSLIAVCVRHVCWTIKSSIDAVTHFVPYASGKWKPLTNFSRG